MTRDELQWRQDRVSQLAKERGITFGEALAWIERTDDGKAWAALQLEQLRKAMDEDGCDGWW